jgi:hypothetical protein
MTNEFTNTIVTARRCAVPLIAVRTADPASTIRLVSKAFAEDDPESKIPVIVWDIAQGLRGVGTEGINALKKVLGDREPAMFNNPAETLLTALSFPQKTVFFFCNAHRFLVETTNGIASSQSVWNLRDEYKRNERTLILLAPDISLPAELRQDVVVLDEPLPDTDELKVIATKMHEAAGIKLNKKDGTLEKLVEATRGLSAFSAEQVVAMSITENGVDLDALWERKRKTVEQTPGLSIYRGTETYADIQGVPVIKGFLTEIMNGKEPPTVLVFMDEIEKMFAGIEGDTSGTSQEQHGEFLRWMQDKKALGYLSVGHPGCSKSFFAKCTAGEFKIPMVELNMTALQGGVVGQTGEMTRNAFKVISAIGKPLVMATSNSLSVLPPELRRRFQLGTFFFDLPDKGERLAVWDIYIKKLGLGKSAKDEAANLPDDSNWTPAEIETCCNIAWRLNCSLKRASNYVVPISRSAPEKIERLRKDADQKFLSASYEGTYDRNKLDAAEPTRSIRFSKEQVGNA